MRTCFNWRSGQRMLAALLTTLFLSVPASHAQLGELQTPEGVPLGSLLKYLQADPRHGPETQMLLVLDPEQELLGGKFGPLNKVLRGHLNVPEGQGVVVESLQTDGPSAQAGLMPFDVLLALGDKPIASVEDLSKFLKSAGDGPVTLKLLREGKPTALQVQPIYRVTLGPAHQKKEEYFLGVGLQDLDQVVRSQLAIPAGRGVVINDVVADSPAEKAGIKPLDILLEYAGKPIGKPDELAAQVQAGQDKPHVMKLIRSGKPLSVTIAAGVRKVEGVGAELPYKRAIVVLKQDAELQMLNPSPNAKFLNGRIDMEPAITSAQRIDQLEKEIQMLRRAVEQLKAAARP